jgi:RNA polymerase sigma-70 factor (ECF subfamily)
MREAEMAEARRGGDAARGAEVDRRTLERCRQRDPIAFRVFVARYERPLFALLSRMLGRGPHVQDLAQEAFIRAYEAFPRFDPDGAAKPSTWLLTIGTRLALDWAKSPQRAREANAVVGVDLPGSPEGRLDERRELGRTIERAARELTPEQRAVLILADLHEMSIPEIAEAVGVPEGTVKSRLSRAREHMRERLRPLRRP